MNPQHVVYFYPLKKNINGNKMEITVLTLGSSVFWINMRYDEFCDFWDGVKRSFDLEEPLF